MKNLFIPAIFFLISFSLFSQNNLKHSAVAQIDYFKVKDQDVNAYLSAEKEWKKVHEERKKSGKILAWFFFEVLLPNGSSVDHNYLTVTLYPNYGSIETVISDIILAYTKVYPNVNLTEKLAKDYALRDRVKTDFDYNSRGYWKGGQQGVPDFKYVLASLNKVHEADEMSFKNELNYWEKLLIARAEMGMEVGFQYGQIIHSHGTSDPYSHYIFQFYDDFKQTDTENNRWGEAAIKAYPNSTNAVKDMLDRFSTLTKIRSVYRDELWRLLDSVK